MLPDERRWVPQPAGTRLCGQVAFAVLTGLTLDQAIRQFGHRHGTKTKEMVRHLRAFGYDCPDRLRACRRPELALAKLSREILYQDAYGYVKRLERNWHWVVVDGDKIWDGETGDETGQPWGWHPTQRITSYLPLTRRAT